LLVALAVVVAVALGLLLLPVAFRLAVHHPGPAGPTAVELSCGLWAGALGVRRAWGPSGGDWSLEMLGWRVVRVARTRSPASPEARSGPSPAPPVSRPQGQPAWRRLAALYDLAGQPARGLLSGLCGAIRVRRLHLRGRFGFEDPALTGRAYGWLQAAAGLLPGRVRLEVRPDFEATGVSGQAALRVHLHLGRLLAVLLRFGLHFGWRWLRARLTAPAAAAPTQPG
jgi:hypothetical protein